eukprot:NODE_175_length_14138_cov_1.015314.p4 type:complete len:454 gc:universal NODE_175_length_14138_cov_1.015314:9692-8331(-)
MWIYSSEGIEQFKDGTLKSVQGPAEICHIHDLIATSNDRNISIQNNKVDCEGDVRFTKYKYTVIDTLKSIVILKNNELHLEINGKRADQIEVSKDCIFHLHNHTLTCYSNGSKNSVTLHGLNRISLSPDESYLCLFLKKKNGPSFAKLCHVSDIKSFVSSATLMSVQYIEFYWCKDYCIVQAINESGGGYYGNSFLYLLNVNGYTARIPLAKEGPIHHVAWNPIRIEFCVIYGYMPASIDIFNTKCDVVKSFKADHKNYCKFSHNGKLLVISGFGNMPGDTEVYSTEGYTMTGSFRASLTSELYFTSDNQQIITATFYRRLKVDNGITLWHPSGCKINFFAKERLFAVFEDLNPDVADTFVLKDPPQGAIVEKAPNGKKYIPPSKRGGSNVVGANPVESNINSKKIKAIKKKLKEIESLKNKQKEGLVLDEQQSNKISRQNELALELEQLSMQ